MIRVDPANLATDPAPAGADAVEAAAPTRALVERQLAMLTRLAEVGMQIVEAAGRQASAPPAEGDDGAAALRDAGLTYSRVARAVRLTFALQTQLLKDLAAFEKAGALVDDERTSRRREGLVRLAKQALDADYEGLTGRELDRYAGEVRERLREVENFGDVMGDSFAEVVAAICADLQLSPEWTARLLAAAQGAPLTSSSGGAPQARRPEDPASATEPFAFIEDGAAGSSGLRSASPEDDEEDTFLEWPPPR